MNSSRQQKRIYFGNLDKEHDSEEIRQLFERMGEVVHFHCYSDEGYVEYQKEEEAKEALTLNGH